MAPTGWTQILEAGGGIQWDRVISSWYAFCFKKNSWLIDFPCGDVGVKLTTSSVSWINRQVAPGPNANLPPWSFSPQTIDLPWGFTNSIRQITVGLITLLADIVRVCLLTHFKSISKDYKTGTRKWKASRLWAKLTLEYPLGQSLRLNALDKQPNPSQL